MAGSRTDHLLISWALASGPTEREIAASTALTLEPERARALTFIAIRLDAFLRRLVQRAEWRPPEFPLAKEFFAAGLDSEVEAAVRTALSLYESRGAKVKQISSALTDGLRKRSGACAGATLGRRTAARAATDTRRENTELPC